MINFSPKQVSDFINLLKLDGWSFVQKSYKCELLDFIDTDYFFENGDFCFKRLLPDGWDCFEVLYKGELVRRSSFGQALIKEMENEYDIIKLIFKNKK